MIQYIGDVCSFYLSMISWQNSVRFFSHAKYQQMPILFKHMISFSFSYSAETSIGTPAYKTHMKMTIFSVSQADFTTYKCVAKNPRGETDGSIRLYGESYGFLQLSVIKLTVSFFYLDFIDFCKESSYLLFCGWQLWGIRARFGLVLG